MADDNDVRGGSSEMSPWSMNHPGAGAGSVGGSPRHGAVGANAVPALHCTASLQSSMPQLGRQAVSTALRSCISVAVHAALGPLQLHRHGGAERYPALRPVGFLREMSVPPSVEPHVGDPPKCRDKEV
jgi:hypothetical protein